MPCNPTSYAIQIPSGNYSQDDQDERNCSFLSNNKRYTLPGVDYGSDEDVALNADIIPDFGEDVVDVTLIPMTCGGRVSAVEYCYSGVAHPNLYERTYQALTLLALERENPLERENHTFTTTDVILVYTIPTAQKCSIRTFNNVVYCCDTFQLSTAHQLPAQSFAFGVGQSTSPEILLLRYESSYDREMSRPDFLAEQYSFSRTEAPQVGDNFTLDNSSRTTDRGMRVLRLVISKSDTYILSM